MKKVLSKVVLAGLFFQAQISFAQTVPMPVKKPYEVCKSIQVAGGENGEMISMPDMACNKRNAQIDKVYALELEGYNRAKTLNADGKPTQPTHSCVDQGSADYPDYNYQMCMGNYNNKMKEYKKQMAAYDISVKVQAEAAQGVSAESTLTDTTTTGSLAEMEAKNKSGSSMYAMAGAALAFMAYQKFVAAQACSGASMGTCVPPLMAAGAAYMLLNGKANKQAGDHALTAYESCIAYNQLSSTQKVCPPDSSVGSVISNNPGSGTTTISDIDPATGLCKPDAPPTCTSSNVGGANVSKVSNGGKGSSLAGGLPFKQNPDGSITTKDGKTYKLSDFADTAAMIAAGMSPAGAQELSNQLYGSEGTLAKAGLDTKGLLKELGDKNKSLDYGSLSSGSAAVNTVDPRNEADLNKSFKDSLSNANRKPSSAGLTRDFNGELIGAAGDDIFSMMNRRYKLKNQQDSFIAP